MAKKRSPRAQQPCYICMCPYRRELEKLIESGVAYTKIAEKYTIILGKKPDRLRYVLASHTKRDHQHTVPNQVTGVRALHNGNEEKLDVDTKKVVDFEVAAEQLLSIGMQGADSLNAKDALKLATQLQRTHLEGRKVRVSEDALKITAAKFFGGFLGKPKEGEIITDAVNSGLPLSIESEN